MVTSGGDKVQLQSKDSGAIDESTTFDQNDGWIFLEFKVRINHYDYQFPSCLTLPSRQSLNSNHR